MPSKVSTVEAHCCGLLIIRQTCVQCDSNERFEAIGKAFATLSDTKKREQYDNYGPSAFEADDSSNAPSRSRYSRGASHAGHYQNYWNDDEFSADELFNLFFGNVGGNATHHRRRAQTHNMNAGQSNFVFASSVSQPPRHSHSSLAVLKAF